MNGMPKTSPDKAMPLYRKFLLSAAMMGNEFCVAFQQLYTVPLLQMLGVPITFVSIHPLVAGPVALLVMSVIGYFCDRGSNHRTRKAIFVVLNSAFTLLGIGLLIVANSMVLSSLGGDECGSPGSGTSTNGSCSEATTTWPGGADDQNLSFYESSRIDYTTMAASTTAMSDGDSSRTAANMSGALEEDGWTLPMTGWLGLSAFGLMDIGYDANQASIRACILGSSCPGDHTLLLLLTLVLAALGGCLTNVLGLVDLTGLVPGAAGADDGSLAAQTTAQLLICMVVLVITIASTVITALFNIRHLAPTTTIRYTPLSGDDDTRARQPITYYGGVGTTERTEDGYGRPAHLDNEKETSFEGHDDDDGGKRMFYHQSDETLRGSNSGMRKSVRSNEDESSPHSEKKTSTSQVSDQSSFAGVDSLSVVSRRSCPPSTTDPANSRPNSERRHLLHRRGWDKGRVNFITACVGAYLGTSVLFAYNLYVTDFVGTEVVGGDSTAPRDSAEYQAYADGVRLGAGGLLTFYCCYLLICCVHSKLLGALGLKVGFSLSHALMAAAILCLTLSKEVAAFYVCCVLYGFQRASLFSVPFIIASNYAREKEQSSGGRSATGKTMAMVGCAIPLNYCTVFLISGPLITLTGYEGAPLLLSSVCTGLASLVVLLFYAS